MKANKFIKIIPLLSTLLLISYICISNQKEYTKIKILLWNTPSLPLGTYLAISSGSGFILSYLITTKLAKLFIYQKYNSINYKEDETEYNNEYVGNKSILTYENTLIERDIKDPSPTVNANFRVIGKTERSQENNLRQDNTIQNEFSDESGNYYFDENQNISKEKLNSTDWNDDRISDW